MSMSTSGSEDSAKERTAAAGGVGERNEVSGLHDIRALAANTITRHNEKVAQDIGEVADALLASTSPATLGQVVLPVPGKEVSQAVVAASVSKAVDPKLAVAAAAVSATPQSSGWARTMVIALAVLIAGGAVAFVMYNKNKQQAEVAAVTTPEAPLTAAGATPTSVEPVAAPLTPPADTEVKPADPAVVAMADPAKPEPKAEKDVAPAAPREVAKVDPKAKDAKPEEKGKEMVAAITPVETKPADTKPAEPPKAEEKPKDAIEQLLGAAPEDNTAKETKAAEDLPTELADAEVKKGMGGIKARVQDCYARYKVPGMVKVKTTIEPDGGVSSAVAVDDKFANTETGQCVADAVQLAKFKKWSGAQRVVTYPFVLK